MKRAVLAVTVAVLCRYECTQASELAQEVYAPIVHQKYFKFEKELFDYNPKFVPNPVTFDSRNRPYIRDGNSIQTLDEQGNWIRLDYTEPIRKKYPNWDGKIGHGDFFEERTIFDTNDRAYIHVSCVRDSSLNKSLVLFSRDFCRTWQVYDLPIASRWAKLEFPEFHNEVTGPPAILLSTDQPDGTQTLHMVCASINGDGTLLFSEPILICRNATNIAFHSGASNASITRGCLTHIIWGDMGYSEAHKTQGVATFATTYDRGTKRLMEPVLIGYGGNDIDNHNWPTMTVDSKGYLHAIISGHGQEFRYTHSKESDSTRAWTKTEIAGYPVTKIGDRAYTYPAMMCGQDDTLHIFCRWGCPSLKQTLSYLWKEPGKGWQQKVLVEPFRNLYCRWQHKLNVDHYGRFFINYNYLPNELRPNEVREYIKKYPDDRDFKSQIPDDLDKYVNGVSFWPTTLMANSMLVSEDSGKSWRLVVTSDFAKWVKPAQAVSIPSESRHTNSIGMEFILVKPGSFMMGDDNAVFDEAPAHKVFITKPFYLGKYQVTVGQFRKFADETGFKTQAETGDDKYWGTWLNGKISEYNKTASAANWRHPDFEQSDDDPVVCINDDDAFAFCAWLSKKENRKYRLPSEAQWEYACRAGTATLYSFGNNRKDVGLYAWYNENSSGKTHPVGQKRPNPWGFYDMHGNVWEFCQDWYGPYGGAISIDPQGLSEDSGAGRVIRGGSWIDDIVNGNGCSGIVDNGLTANNLRSSARYFKYVKQIKLNFIGMRLVLECDAEKDNLK